MPRARPDDAARPPSDRPGGPSYRWRLAGPVLFALAAAALATTQLLGPSATEPPLGRHDSGATPPWHLAAGPPDWLVTALLYVAVLAGTAGVATVLCGRWHPRASRLAVAGGLVAATLALLPPIGSADTLSYAAYGRMVATGRDPYATTPADLASSRDPVGAAVEVPWRHTSSVYGPLATAEQAAASAVAGRDVAMTVWLLGLVAAAAFVGAGLVLFRIAADDAARLRAAALWLANPLLWLQLVAGAHVDVVVAVLMISALAVVARSRLAAGGLAAAAASVKAPGGLVWPALAWADRRSPRALGLLTAGAIAIAVPGYAVAGSDAFHQLSRASRLVSLATPWRPVLDTTGAPRRLIGTLALALFVALSAAALRRPPHGPVAAVVALCLAMGYILAAPYALPWYDAVAWVFAPVVAASWRDGVLLAHTAVLSLAYVPGRAAAPLHGALQTLTGGMRTRAAPALLTVVLLTAVVYALTRGRRLRDAAAQAAR